MDLRPLLQDIDRKLKAYGECSVSGAALREAFGPGSLSELAAKLTVDTGWHLRETKPLEDRIVLQETAP